jgi:phage-related minor tail protein
MALTVGELAATITVDDDEAERGLTSFHQRLRSALSRATQQAHDGGRDAGGALGDGLTDGAGEGADRAGESITGKLKGLALGAIGGSLGAALMGGIAEAMNQEQIAGKLGAQLGSTPAEAQRYGKIAGSLYAHAVTEDFQGAADAIKATMGSGLLPPDATNAQIESISTKVSDLATTFDQDLGGVTNAVSQMLRTGLASSADEAFDVLTKGFQSSANKGDDLLDTFNEYGTQFRKAGLDGATAVGLMNQAISHGARDSDIAADAIKEFSIRAIDGSKTTADGFKALGLNADDMAAKFSKGGKSASGALDTTLDRLRAIKDPVKQSAAATALFGTQAEDLGAALFAMDPSSAAAGLGKVGGAADKVGSALRDNASTQVEQFKRQATQAFVELLGTKVVPILTKVGGYLQEHGDVAKVLAAAVLGLGVAFGIATVAVWAMNSALLANPIFWIIAGIGLAVAGLVILFVTYWDQIKAATLAVWDWIVAKIMWVKDALIFMFMNFTLPGLLLSHWDSIRAGAVAAWNGIVGWLSAIPGRASSALSSLGTYLSTVARNGWTSFKTATVGKVVEFISYIRGIPGRVKSALGNMGSLLVNKGIDLVRGLVAGVKRMGGWLRSQLISFAKAMIPGPIAKALGIHSPSRVMRDQIGRWIPAGIVAGVEDGAPAVESTMRNLVSVPTASTATAAKVAASTGTAIAASNSTAPAPRLVLDVTGNDAQWKALVRRMVRVDGRGNVQLAFGS